MTGLALSGGGIRSATFSLGLIEALAKSERDALSKIDILSTVSGGGYIGCFLRSLFVPDEARGIAPNVEYEGSSVESVALDPAAVADQYRFARRVLSSGTSERDIEWNPPDGRTVERRNPLWWLREHSRYLAPNGPTDYGYAVAYIARNWAAMLYIFLLGSLAIASAVILIEALFASQHWLPNHLMWIPVGGSTPPACPCSSIGVRFLPISPVFLVAILPIAASLILSVSYWMTERMSPNEPDFWRQWRNLGSATLGTLIGAILIIALAAVITPGALELSKKALELRPAGTLFAWLLTIGVLLMVLSAVTALVMALFLLPRGVALTSELRNHLTSSLAASNQLFLIILLVGLVDSFGAGLALWLRNPPRTRLQALGTVLLPALAFLIKKLPDWFGGSGKGSVFSLMQRFMSTIALAAGFILYGSVAVLADAFVHLGAWAGNAWEFPMDWKHLFLSLGIIWVLAILSGVSDGFINLSSLHFLYASRLTRAYLGATNNFRLEAAAKLDASGSIKANHRSDYIQPELYSRADLPAPVHIINTTINETIDPQSQLVARDRKGDVLSLEPTGIRVGSRLVPWGRVGERECAEQLSLGQWCAISGAAASSGMGRLTNLGFALAFTFANVRLGYWWWSPGVREHQVADNRVRKLLAKVFGTFVYLFNEMTARYSRDYARKYLTDGGHFENSGAYRLIQRNVPLILVSDNGADSAYRFEDLENLCRLVRLDFGYEIELLRGGDLAAFLDSIAARDASIFVDPARWPDWRSSFTNPHSPAYVLALRVRGPEQDLHVLWVKPRLLRNMPPDLLGYASSNPAFPQQPTSDQFFDEAQWESYRRLGDLSMARLLESCPALLV